MVARILYVARHVESQKGAVTIFIILKFILRTKFIYFLLKSLLVFFRRAILKVLGIHLFYII